MDLARQDQLEVAAGHDRSIGFFASTAPLGSSYSQLNSDAGDCREMAVTKSMQDAWESVTGYRPSGAQLVDLLWDHLTNGASPNGVDFVAPLIPTAAGLLELHLGGHSLVRSGVVDWTSRHGQAVKGQLKSDLGKVTKDSLDGKMIDPASKKADKTIHQKVAGGLLLKYPQLALADIQPANWPKDDKTKKPTTTITESFNAGDSSVLGPDLEWQQFRHVDPSTVDTTEMLSVVSDRCFCQVDIDNNSGLARAEVDLSSSDHYAQCVTYDLGDGSNEKQIGAYARSTTGTTLVGYLARVLIADSLRRVEKSTSAGVFTTIINAALTIAAGPIIKSTANGSSITGTWNGTNFGTATDTTITSGTRTGVYAHSSSLGGSHGDVILYAFEAADLAAGTPMPPLANYYNQLLRAA